MNLTIAVLLAVTALGCAADDPVRVVLGEQSSITVTVRLPDDWPDATYDGTPTLVVEWDNGELSVPATGGQVVLGLPGPGDYRIGAEVGDDGCVDTAGITDGGNEPVSLAGGETIVLHDTGELCD